MKIPPGSTVGLLGGGQLARMTALAARPLGYRVHLFDPHPEPPAGVMCERVFRAPFDDKAALADFARSVDVATLEFENIPVEALAEIERHVPVRPRGAVLHVTQHREREKIFLRDHGFPCAPFRLVNSPAELAAALVEIGPRAVLKTAEFGYDGKGQRKIEPGEDVPTAWRDWTGEAEDSRPHRGVLEAWIDFAAELSVICARRPGGEMVTFPVAENEHEDHILAISIAPGRFPPEVHREAEALARSIAESLQVEGLLAVEMFLTKSGELLVNELAPRPHNSGHYTIDACVTSQFEQHVRAVCDLPLGGTTQHSETVMINLLGDLWPEPERAPDWLPILREPAAKLHLYGKRLAKPGRKMGHFTVLADRVESALATAMAIRAALRARER
ncbi:5-(carboxyamino)imidazole ribonucleotide synthase [Verrucomicrobia bacterium SCGC AG-212-E04]|nr:5-(carboxyamino)imidazole ribonucleotide synthase [Verrucomicrobia bacterium SCGC AG-212-E04]